MKKLNCSYSNCRAFFLRFCRRVNPVELVRFFSRVLHHAGGKFFVLLISNYLFIRGAQGGLSSAALLPYMKNLGYTSAVYQRVACMSGIPFCLKGLMGTLSDLCPIGGYRKKYYMIIGTLSGIIGVAGLSFIPDSIVAKHVWLIFIGVFLCFFELSTLALMCSGTYSEMMNKNRKIGSDFVTFCFFMYNVGNLMGRSVAGTVSDAVGGKPVFYIALPIAAHVLLPIILNFLPEERVHSGVKITSLKQHQGLFSMALLVAAGSLGLAVVNMMMIGWLSLAYCSVVLVVFTILLYSTLELLMAKCCTYVFLWGAVNVSISGAIDYFMTAPRTCLENGPHFSYTYYSTYTSALGTLATLVALWLFQSYFVNWTYVHISWVTSGVKGLAALFDYMIVTRLTARLGIPDTAVFLLGDAIVVHVVRALHSMPAFMLTSKLCPPGLESTAYAIMDGVSYAGQNISAQVGAFIIDKSGISTSDAQTCNFDNLGMLILATQLAIPIATIPFTFYLLPQVPISGELKCRENPVEDTAVDARASPVASQVAIREQLDVHSGTTS